jgi:hypothetical protein
MRTRVLLLSSLLALGACQTTSEAPAPAAPSVKQEQRGVVPTPASFHMPQGSGCSGDIARFRAIQANDLDTGHTTKAVYDQIEGEMKRADALCSAGNAGAASAHVRATRSRFGYPQ